MAAVKAVPVALQALAKEKTRAFVMMLGVIVGVATMTAVVLTGMAARRQVAEGIRAFGPDAVVISAGGGAAFAPPDERVTTLAFADAEALRVGLPGVRHVAPFTCHREQTILAGARSAVSSVAGVTPEFADAWQWLPERGAFIVNDDLSSLSRNAVIGRTVARELFGDRDPIGEQVRIGTTTFLVVGVLARRGTSPTGVDMDRHVMIPLSTAMRQVYGIDHVSMIRVLFEEGAPLDEAAARASLILRERHGVTPPAGDDFKTVTTTGMVAAARGEAAALGTALGALAAVSLVSLAVGGIVIATMMSRSVGDRRQEIGTRRAAGACAREIRGQFLAEALFVTAGGAVVGTLLGTALFLALARTKGIPAVISWQPFALAAATAVIVGVLAGVGPARRAAAPDPAEAIRG